MEYIFAVIILILINISCFILFIRTYKNMVKEQIESISKKADEIEVLLDNADQMTNELNNLSGYIVSEFEQSNKLYEESYAKLGEKVQQGNDLIVQLNQLVDECKDLKEKVNTMRISVEIDSENESLEAENYSFFEEEDKNSHNPKFIKAEKLAKQGLSIREIAQQLNMGQEEIKLVLEMKKTVAN